MHRVCLQWTKGSALPELNMLRSFQRGDLFRWELTLLSHRLSQKADWRRAKDTEVIGENPLDYEALISKENACYQFGKGASSQDGGRSQKAHKPRGHGIQIHEHHLQKAVSNIARANEKQIEFLKVDGRGNNSSKVSLNFGRRGGPKGMPKRRGLHPLSSANVIQVDGNGLSADTESDEWAHDMQRGHVG
ncbi:unnamed protein product [Larinioides sclopetarius]|uniref:Uncharacterized protein n=1 Tax=Larinioides sclopetarius TaxID=280406 RepID=A0AAV1YTX1_9ARAC